MKAGLQLWFVVVMAIALGLLFDIAQSLHKLVTLVGGTR